MGKGKHRTPNAERRMTERSQFEVALLSVLCELYVMSEGGEENVQRRTGKELRGKRKGPKEATGNGYLRSSIFHLLPRRDRRG